MQTSETEIIFCYIFFFTLDLFIYFVCAVTDKKTNCHLIKMFYITSTAFKSIKLNTYKGGKKQLFINHRHLKMVNI